MLVINNIYVNKITVNSRRNKQLERRWRTYLYQFLCCCLCASVVSCGESQSGVSRSWYQHSSDNVTEITNSFINKRFELEKSLSPYVVREDIVVGKEGHLIIHPGVEIRFAPMVGITVRGTITAKVSFCFQ